MIRIFRPNFIKINIVKEVEILTQALLCQYNFMNPQTLFYPGYYPSDFFGGVGLFAHKQGMV